MTHSPYIVNGTAYCAIDGQGWPCATERATQEGSDAAEAPGAGTPGGDASGIETAAPDPAELVDPASAWADTGTPAEPA